MRAGIIRPAPGILIQTGAFLRGWVLLRKGIWQILTPLPPRPILIHPDP